MLYVRTRTRGPGTVQVLYVPRALVCPFGKTTITRFSSHAHIARFVSVASKQPSVHH
jgi:hypothetical protein